MENFQQYLENNWPRERRSQIAASATEDQVRAVLRKDYLQPADFLTLLSPAAAPLLEQIFRAMFDECSRRSAGYEQMCHSLLESALIVILRLLNQRSAAAEAPRPFDEISGDSLALKAKTYIEDNYMRKITMRDIADELHISYYHLSHMFKQELSLSPQDYLISYRMNEACRLLTTTQMPISLIAARVGYGNQSHFNVQFKTIKGLSPGQYRRIYSDGDEFGAPDEEGDDARDT